MSGYSQDFPKEIINEWQSIVDLVAHLAGVKAGLIMRLVEDDIEVFVSSKTGGNPYKVGDGEHFFNSGLYCETVITKQERLLVPNALKSDKWRNSPDIKLNMVSYLGFPINFPGGKPFGTICLLDDKENTYSTDVINLMEKMCSFIEIQLSLVEENRLQRQFASESLLRKILDNIPTAIGCATLPPEFKTLYLNEQFINKFGYTTNDIPTIDRWFALTCKDELYSLSRDQQCRTLFEKELQQYGRVESMELRVTSKGGSAIDILISAIALQGMVLISFVDITNRKQLEDNLKESESLLKEAQHLAKIGHWEMDPAVGTPAWSEEIFHIFGLDPEQGEPSFENHQKIVHPDDWDILNNAITQSSIDGAPFDIEFRIFSPDKSIRWVNGRGYATKDNEDKVIRIFGTAQDITERKHLEERLLTISISDELTGLYNRRGFITLSEQQLKIAERTKKDMLLFFADLDKMKLINDTLGHQEGDKALIDISTILKEVFRESDIIGRIGGDEFAVLAIDTTDETRDVLVNRLHNTLDDYNRPEGRNYQLSLSIGIAHYNPETPLNLDELMAQADELMYEEKRKKQG
jgi:diguanylate cyclase (GGDEF)-like protein/PAS domain S-box-containing protein